MAKKDPADIKVSLKITPTTGDAIVRHVTVRSPTVGDVLAAASVAAADKNLTVNGEPADLATPVAPGDRVLVEERPAGS